MPKLWISNSEPGLLGSNSYLVWDTESGDGMIIDCGARPEGLKETADGNDVNVKYLVLTHGHYDHAEYLSEYARLFPKAETVAHEAESAVLSDPMANVSVYFGPGREYQLPDRTVKEGDTLALGELIFSVLSTPGHTPGSICLYCESEQVMFTGDTLFSAGYGRTDFKLGSPEDMRASLSRLFKMKGVTFYSGHGEPAVI